MELRKWQTRLFTALGDIHKFDSDFLIIFFVLSKYDLAKTALTKLSYYLIVV